MFKLFGLKVCLHSSSRHLLTIRRVTLTLLAELFEFSTDTLSSMPELPTPLCRLDYHQMQLAPNVSLFFNVISASMYLYTIYGSTGCFSPPPNTLRLLQKRTVIFHDTMTRLYSRGFGAVPGQGSADHPTSCS
jgi:hypothetical protein